jgi:hypothetical protein
MRRGPAPADGEADCDKKKNWTDKKVWKFVLLKADLVLQLLQAFSDFFIGPVFFNWLVFSYNAYKSPYKIKGRASGITAPLGAP